MEVARRKEELQIYKGETERLRSEKVRLHTDLVDISEQHKLALSEVGETIGCEFSCSLYPHLEFRFQKID